MYKEKIFSTPRNPCHVLLRVTDLITKGRGWASSARCCSWTRVVQEGAVRASWGKEQSARDTAVRAPETSMVDLGAKIPVECPLRLKTLVELLEATVQWRYRKRK